jgi:pyridoxal phosphate enzyme (YggS family)
MSTLAQILAEIQTLKVAQKVRVLAVSKLQSTEKIRALHALGQIDFGENYVQELLPKVAELAGLGLHWHFIGKLQRNKVKQLIGYTRLIHSVDSLGLAEEISKRAEAKSVQQKILWQLNLSKEETKAGNHPENVEADFLALSKLKNIEVVGLMTMPPLFENPEQVRPYFQQLKQIQNHLRHQYPSCLELSMGTSADWRVAVTEGATLIRLGTVLFGARPLA